MASKKERFDHLVALLQDCVLMKVGTADYEKMVTGVWNKPFQGVPKSIRKNIEDDGFTVISQKGGIKGFTSMGDAVEYFASI